MWRLFIAGAVFPKRRSVSGSVARGPSSGGASAEDWAVHLRLKLNSPLPHPTPPHGPARGVETPRPTVPITDTHVVLRLHKNVLSDHHNIVREQFALASNWYHIVLKHHALLNLYNTVLN